MADQGPVLNDVTASHIDTVMGEATTRRNEVRAQGWLFICGQEPIAAGEIDLGEAVAQQLAVSLDPYPRAPGATLASTGEAEAQSPFAALAALKKKP